MRATTSVCYNFSHVFQPFDTRLFHYNDVIMGAIASQITSLTIVYSTVYSGADQRKHQSSVSLAFVRGIHRSPVNSPHKWPVTRKMFQFDDVIMLKQQALVTSMYGGVMTWKRKGTLGPYSTSLGCRSQPSLVCHAWNHEKSHIICSQ